MIVVWIIGIGIFTGYLVWLAADYIIQKRKPVPVPPKKCTICDNVIRTRYEFDTCSVGCAMTTGARF